MSLVGSFPFNAFLSGVLSCVGTAVLAGDMVFLDMHQSRLLLIIINIQSQNHIMGRSRW